MLNRSLILLLTLFMLSACLNVGEIDTPVSEQRCGDEVCDGPENETNCPQDCIEASSLTNKSSSEEDKANGAADDNPQGENPGERSTELIAEVYFDVNVTRRDGVGDCGVEPWGVDHIDGGDFSCPPPKYWFGEDLHATAHQQVALIQQGQGWVFAPHSSGGGTYQKAISFSDGQRVCEPVSVIAEPFDLSIEGATAEGDIVLEISTKPTENAIWQCDNGNTYERETTLLLIDWGIAVSGSHDSLTTLLTQADRQSQSRYQHMYVLDTNPSPDDRDHVEVDVSFTCMKPGQEIGSYVESPCPW